MLRRVSRTMATIVALSAVVMVSQAGAANKLEVKGTDGTTTKFAVTDTGAVTASDVVLVPKLGLGTSNPVTPFHAADSIATASRGVLVAQHNDTSAGASIVFRKSRGTEASPSMPSTLEDYIGIFAAQYWNGGTYDRAGQFGFRNDAPATAPVFNNATNPPTLVSAGAMPVAIMFYTGSKTQNGSDLSEGMRISSIKNVVVGNAGGTATADLPSDSTSGFLYIPSVNGALSTCASIPPGRTASVGNQHPGHVPVWFDTSSSKICTCQGSTLKCTAALN